MLLLAIPLAHLAFLTGKLWRHCLMFAGFKRVAPEHAIGMRPPIFRGQRHENGKGAWSVRIVPGNYDGRADLGYHAQVYEVDFAGPGGHDLARCE